MSHTRSAFPVHSGRDRWLVGDFSDLLTGDEQDRIIVNSI